MSQPITATPRWTAYVPLSNLAPAIRNPKLHDMPSLIASVKRFGFTTPCLADERTGRLAAGHGRLAALVNLKEHGDSMPSGLIMDDDGEWLVPVTRGWSSKNDIEAEAYIIADNQLTIAGGWHMQTLASMAEEIATQDASLFESMGVTAEDLDDWMRRIDPESLNRPSEGGEDAAPAGGGGGRDSDLDDGEAKPRLTECPACGHPLT